MVPIKLVKLLGAALIFMGFGILLGPLISRIVELNSKEAASKQGLRQYFQINEGNETDSTAAENHMLEMVAVVSSTNQTVAKTVYSSKLRLVYLVGLEGTGHHYLADVLDSMCRSHQFSCPKMCQMAMALYPGLGNPKTADEYVKARRVLRREMQLLAAVEDKGAAGQAILASFGKCRNNRVGMMSYPNFNGDRKTLQYVDFRILAEEAELAGVDLRIIYLTRPAQEIVVSDTKHNNYGNTFIFETRSLVANADVVASTFRELSPDFSTCFYYGNMTSREQAKRIAKFVAPKDEGASRLARSMIRAIRKPSKRRVSRGKDAHTDFSNPESAEALIVGRLQQKLDAIEKELCR